MGSQRRQLARKRQLNRMRAFAVLSILGLAAASDPFLQFAREHGRNYKSGAEVHLRREIFNENYKSMMEHNARFEAGVETWTRKVTPFYDHTMQEVAAMLTSGLPAYDNTTVFVDRADEAYLEKLAEVRTQSAPDSWSWVQQGGISSVKNQGQCGSCAAFATVAVIETCFWQQRGVILTTSPNNTLWTVPSTTTTTIARGLGELLDVTGLGRQLTWIGL